MLPTRALCARSVWKGESTEHRRNQALNKTACANSSSQVPTLFRKSQPQRLRPVSTDQDSLPIVQKKAGERVPPIKTQARSATILPTFVGFKFQIHNGKNYMDLTITEDMVGHKLGEFAPTRKQFTYKQTKNK
ncbi:hypothetical protein NX059_002607 [Plenodomus lindquistii]|nr:hypothetical protein NX059_002607 [Plenodomus lindquistii]